jgi:hypothetical protein
MRKKIRDDLKRIPDESDGTITPNGSPKKEKDLPKEIPLQDESGFQLMLTPLEDFEESETRNPGLVIDISLGDSISDGENRTKWQRFKRNSRGERPKWLYKTRRVK